MGDDESRNWKKLENGRGEVGGSRDLIGLGFDVYQLLAFE